MIEYALLIMLGFCIGGLIAFLLAPTIWHRAVRLTTKRLEATMPMSLSEIEADKDLLRASYAIRIRRLETGLNKARDKSANQLVDLSKLQMQISALNGKIAALNAELEERTNAANVFESTIRKRFPELENMIAVAKAALDDRALEIADLNNKLLRREEMLAMAQRSANLQQEEIKKLRETLEKTGSDATGRFKRRPSQWTLDEYRSEYDRLNVEISKMREQLVLAQERENRQTAVLKTELQQLAERIMSSAFAGERLATDWREAGYEPRSGQEPFPNRSVRAPARGFPAQSVSKTQPWPGDRPTAVARTSHSNLVSRENLPVESRPGKAGLPPDSAAHKAERQEPAAPNKAALLERSAPIEKESSVRAAGQIEGERKEKQAYRNALKSLLDRGAKLTSNEQLEKSAQQASGAGAAVQAKGLVDTVSGDDSHSTSHSRNNGASAPADEAKAGVGAPAAGNSPGTSEKTEKTKLEPKLDQVFREILEGPSTSQADALSAPSSKEDDNTAKTGASRPEISGDGATGRGETASRSASEVSKTQTLLDRLRVMQERQTG